MSAATELTALRHQLTRERFSRALEVDESAALVDEVER
jgi:hypothetical protein